MHTTTMGHLQPIQTKMVHARPSHKNITHDTFIASVQHFIHASTECLSVTQAIPEYIDDLRVRTRRQTDATSRIPSSLLMHIQCPPHREQQHRLIVTYTVIVHAHTARAQDQNKNAPDRSINTALPISTRSSCTDSLHTDHTPYTVYRLIASSGTHNTAISRNTSTYPATHHAAGCIVVSRIPYISPCSARALYRIANAVA